MEIDYLSRPIYIFIPSGGFSSLFSFLCFISIRNETEETLLLSYDFLMPTFLFIREGDHTLEKSLFHEVKLPLISRCY